jgi:hypothetical protein
LLISLLKEIELKMNVDYAPSAPPLLEYEIIKEQHRYQIEIPKSVGPGGRFATLIQGKRYELRCPSNKKGGDNHIFSIEVERQIEKLPLAVIEPLKTESFGGEPLAVIEPLKTESVGGEKVPKQHIGGGGTTGGSSTSSGMFSGGGMGGGTSGFIFGGDIGSKNGASNTSGNKEKGYEQKGNGKINSEPINTEKKKRKNPDILKMDPLDVAIMLLRHGHDKKKCQETMLAAGIKKNLVVKSYFKANAKLKSSTLPPPSPVWYEDEDGDEDEECDGFIKINKSIVTNNTTTTNTLPDVDMKQVETIYNIVQDFCATDTKKPYTREDVMVAMSTHKGADDEMLNDVVTRMMNGLHMRTLYEKKKGNINVGFDSITGEKYDNHFGARTMECKICLGDFPMEETYCFDCKDAHRSCVRCAVEHCRAALIISTLPNCIDGQCDHIVSTKELQQLENLISNLNVRTDSGGSGGNLSPVVDESILNSVFETATNMGILSTNNEPYTKEDLRDIIYLQCDENGNFDTNVLISRLFGGLHMETIRSKAKQKRSKNHSTIKNESSNNDNEGISSLAFLPRGGDRVMKKLSEVREELVIAGFLNNRDDVVACPTPDCPGYQFMNDTTRCEKLECHVCQQVYGSRCRLPYHYHVASCDEVQSLARRYQHWKTEQRLPFLQHLAKERKDAKEQLTAYNKRQAQLEEDKKILDAMNKAEQADENYKAANCMHCPKCSKIFTRVDGCDSMICGRNYHGGDQQDGCGHSFNIKNAPRYKAKAIRDRKTDLKMLSKPKAETKHEIIDGVDLTCDACSESIIGPRFECIHCPSFNCCTGCESKIGTTVNHSTNHVFKLHMRASFGSGNRGEEEWTDLGTSRRK